MVGLQVTDEYTRRGIETILMENERLRLEVLSGKGGDITEIRDKRTDVDVLFDVPFEWRPPSDGPVGAPDAIAAFEDHYPGGWQSLLPNGGGPASQAGATLAQHGESSLVPWDAVIEHTGDAVAVHLETELTRYPFQLEREIRLEADDPTVSVEESVTNTGSVPVEYSWVQHVALGEPLVGPEAELEVPCSGVRSDPDHDHPNARVPPNECFEWPIWDAGQVDLRSFPDRDEPIFDLLAFEDLTKGTYTVSNPDLDLGVTVDFDHEFYEYIWYWGAFGGHDVSPFFGRNYNVGLEPATSVPTIGGLDAAIENDTANVIDPGESVRTRLSLRTHPV